MIVLGNVDLIGNLLLNPCMADQTQYPKDAKIGMYAMINRRMMLCIDVGNGTTPVPFWYPLTQQLSMFRYQQKFASPSWLIEHGLNVSTPVVQVYDDSGEVIMPDAIRIVDENNIIVEFNADTKGTVIVLSGNEFGAISESPVIVETFSAATQWALTHNLGRVPGYRVYINGCEVQVDAKVDANTILIDFGITSYAGKLVLF